MDICDIQTNSHNKQMLIDDVLLFITDIQTNVLNKHLLIVHIQINISGILPLI